VLGRWSWAGATVRAVLTARLEEERDPAVLGALVQAVGALRCPSAVGGLLAAAARMTARGAPHAEDLPSEVLRALARIGFADGRVALFFLAQMKDRPWDARLDVVDAAASSEDPRALGVLLPTLADEDRRVRLGVVEALARLRTKAAIEPLLALLAREENQRVRDGVAHALFVTTGQFLYDDLAVWRAWWQEHRATFEVPAEVPVLPKAPKVGKYATTFYGVPVSSERIVFVLDQSGSMAAPHIGPKGEVGGRTQLERAVEEVAQVVAKLGDGARVNVICFETAVHAWKPRLVALGAASRKDLARWLTKREPENGTNLWDGLARAIQMDDVDAIYVLSDGAPNGGRWRRASDILREVLKLNRRRRVAIHCVSLSRDSALLRDLARDNGGLYVRR